MNAYLLLPSRFYKGEYRFVMESSDSIQHCSSNQLRRVVCFLYIAHAYEMIIYEAINLCLIESLFRILLKFEYSMSPTIENRWTQN